jgi:hypothetical protein
LNKIKCNTSKDYSRLIRLFVTIFLIVFTSACLDTVSGQKSGRPISTQQILVTVNPESVFGNACDFVDVLALFNELLTPDGAAIQVALTGSDLPRNLNGCIADFDPVVIDGMAGAKYLSPPLIGVGDLGFVNVAVTSTLQSGISASNFFPVAIQGVGIVSITGPDMGVITSDPDVFATILVDTVGIPPGTIVNFQLTNNSCGFLSNPTPVVGSVPVGAAVVQYTPVLGTECTQTIIVTIVLADPPTKDPDCPSIPIADRTIQDSITFSQIIIPLPTPTPTPTPAPTPTPTPMPPPVIDVSVNSPIAADESTIVTATTNTGANTHVCCDIPIQSEPESFLTIGGASTPPAVCGQTNINGELFAVLTGGNVETLQTILVRCCIDSDTTPSACDPEEPQDNVPVDVEPSGVTQMIEITADPADVTGGEMSILSATTTPPVPGGTPICFEFEENSMPPSTFLIPGPPFCVAAASNGQALIGLEAGDVDMERTIVIKGCIDESLPAGCDPDEPSGFVTVTITPAAPPTPTPSPSIDVTALNEIIEPEGKTFVTASTTGVAPNTNVCCDIPVAFQSDPISSIMPDCGPTNINGDFITLLTGGNVLTEQTIQVRCCIDSNTIPNACDPEEPQDSVFVDINPEGVPPPITLVADPSTILPGDQSAITASTTPPVFPGEICFEIVVGEATTTLFNGMSGVTFLCADTTSLGQAVVGLLDDGSVLTQHFATVKGCINLNPGDGMCDPADPSNLVTVIIAPAAPTPTPTPTPPPVSPITIQATSSLVPPSGNTFINVVTGEAAGTELCVKILVDGTTGGSTIDGPFGAPPAGTACAQADAGGDAIGVINLTISATALSGQQVSLQGCIDNSGTMDQCDGTDPLSSVIFVTVQ